MTPSWAEVEVSLDAWDPEPVRSAVVRALHGAMPQEGQGPERTWPYAQAVRDALSASAGRWYALGPQVGDETVTSWCWCHSFWRPFDASSGAVVDRLEAVADEVMAQVEGCRAWRVGLAGHLRELPRALALDDTRLQGDLLALIGVLVQLGIHDSWYQHVHVAAGWMLQAQGHSVSEALSQRIEALCETRFTSWTEPTAADRAGFADDVTWAVVEALLDRLD